MKAAIVAVSAFKRSASPEVLEQEMALSSTSGPRDALRIFRSFDRPLVFSAEAGLFAS